MESFKEEFIRGFRDYIDENIPGYDYDFDSASNDPWCMPWLWDGTNKWFRDDLTPYGMGYGWALIRRDSIAYGVKRL